MTASILTVDDSVSIRQAIKLTLVGAGFKVEEAENGAEGLEKAAAGDFQLILTDLNMPVMNGLAMIQEIRNRGILVGVPIVFLTTESDAGVKEQAKAAGATGWLTKPFMPEQLLRVVNKVLGQ
jgi:two-component system chemotaxis response regulator CheY